MPKKIISFIAFFIIVIVLWFSFFKPYDHHISFKVDVPPGTLYDMMTDEKTWQNLNKDLIISDKDKFKSLTQELLIDEKPFELLWNFENKNDTNAIVHLDYLNKNNSLKERYLSLFKASDNQDSLIKLSNFFKTQANNFSNSFRVKVNGLDTLPPMVYLYVNQSTTRNKKAGNMIQNNARLFMKNKDSLVTKTGNPFNFVKSWYLSTDSIQFRYAFPVKSQAYYPTDKFVKVDSLPETPVLKATFYGNYSLSDQAWTTLYHYAERNNIPIDLTPIEIFYNNPMFGGNDRQWKAEVFMPLKKSSR
jgi:effector-binding domain-containing protein